MKTARAVMVPWYRRAASREISVMVGSPEKQSYWGVHLL
jgi:hypothetical protein